MDFSNSNADLICDIGVIPPYRVQPAMQVEGEKGACFAQALLRKTCLIQGNPLRGYIKSTHQQIV